MTITLLEAQSISTATLTEARTRGCKPMSVIVLDAGGHPVVYQREDRASLFRFDIARAKAMGALGMGADTRELVARAANNPQFFASLSTVVEGRLALAAGGVLIRDDTGAVRGAVGVSGDTGEVDEACALAGIKSAGLSNGDSK